MGALQPSDGDLLGNSWMRVGVERAMAVPAERVWSTVSDASTWLSWYKPLSVFEPVGEPTGGLGATFRQQDWVWKTESSIVAWDRGREIGLSTSSINMPGLLTKYYRSLTIEQSEDETATTVTLTGAFRFGTLGWLLAPYTYPQMLAALYVEYRSALSGLAELLTSEPSGPA